MTGKQIVHKKKAHQCQTNGPFYIKKQLIRPDNVLTNSTANLKDTQCPSFPRKEVIQPQVPLRLPCYDLAPVTELTIGRRFLTVNYPTSGTPSFHDLTGGVYKAQEHIHRSIADLRLLAIPTSCRRVAAYNPNWGVVFPICSTSRYCVGLSTPL